MTTRSADARLRLSVVSWMFAEDGRRTIVALRTQFARTPQSWATGGWGNGRAGRGQNRSVVRPGITRPAIRRVSPEGAAGNRVEPAG